MYVFFHQIKRESLFIHSIDLDTLLTAANSVRDHFWPRSPSSTSPARPHIRKLVADHEIRDDIGAFFYVFSILLAHARDTIQTRQEEVNQLISEMLESVKKNMTIANNTMYHKQLYWSTHALLQNDLGFDQDLMTMISELHNSSLEQTNSMNLHPVEMSGRHISEVFSPCIEFYLTLLVFSRFTCASGSHRMGG